MPTVETLEIEVKKSATGAASEIDKLTASLASLQSGLTATVSGLGEVARGIESIGTAASTLSAIDLQSQIQGISGGLSGLNQGAQQMADLANAMGLFANEMQAASNSMSAFPSQVQQIITSMNQYSTAARRATSHTTAWGSALKKISFAAVFRKGYKLLASALNKSAEYTETLNMFSVSMGEYAQEAYEYAQTVSEAMGLDPAEWLQNQGVFNSIIKGFGIAGDKAAVMSKNLTQLGYDLSSFYNTSVESAMQKVQSGISGELEPLRRLGYDLSVARLEQEALNLGISKSVSEMTQAEKAQLRYYAMLTQVTTAQGDMARTLDQPANQLRILSAQVTQLSRAIGDLLIPTLNKVLPVAIAVVKALREIVQEAAVLFGIELSDGVDWSAAENALSDVSENLSDAADSAKEMKKYLAGFDELNVLPEQSGAADEDNGSSFDIPLLDYSDIFTQGLENRVDKFREKIEPVVTWIKENLSTILEIAKGIGATFLLWKLANGLLSSINAVSSAVKSIQTGVNVAGQLIGRVFGQSGPLTAAAASAAKVIGLMGTIAGAVITVINAFDAWNNGVDMDNLMGMLGGIALLTAGLAVSFGTVGAAIGALVGGVVLIVAALHDWIKTGELSTEAFYALEAGILAVGVAIGLLVGGWIPVIIAAVAGLVVAIVAHWDEIKAKLSEIWSGITEWLSGVGEWINDNVIQPIKEFFAPIAEWIGTIFEGAWLIVQAVWKVASEWFNENVVQPIVGGFKQLWEDVKSVFEPMVAWIDKNVVQPITSFFTEAWDSIKEAFKTAFRAIRSFAVSILNGLIGKVETFINRIIGGINGLLKGFNKIVTWAGDVLDKDWKGVTLAQEITLPRLYKNGGFVDSGQLFIAREAGAEMVGSIGNRTAVANNDQIVDGIAYGVRNANADVVTAIYSVAQQLIRTIEEQDNGTYLDGARVSARVTSAQNQQRRMYGR